MNQEFANYLETIIKGFVDMPDRVEVKPKQGEQTLVLEIYVAKPDIGKVVGKQGSMAQSLRTVVKSYATKRQIRAVMDIMEG